ncbi:hypothetical protein K431DRAFT_285277 [Polychaeton citri CBS 116435]|uniref:Uncharacterized protein n=1 Tax=Polychaeton citri CBS 116435 TaxID=1314669 RepID=A0A9P4UPQ5_9PEZI|nr:hypothetical protein K431DRAFT_285277 [Polychaeton citri CBS 116435]
MFRGGLVNHSNSIASVGSNSKNEYDFSKTQPWVTTARNLAFVDETQELISIYDRDAENTTYTVSSQQSGGPSTANQDARVSEFSIIEPTRTGSSNHVSPAQHISPMNHVSPAKSSHSHPSPHDSATHRAADRPSFPDLSSPTKKRRLTFSSSYHGTPAAESTSSLSPSNMFHHSPANSWHAPSYNELAAALTDPPAPDLNDLNDAFPELQPTASAPSFLALSSSLSRIYLEAPIWPLRDKEEARLLRHYTENLARNFDLTDPQCHFRKVVPQRAATCPTLLNAIFALSARHLSRLHDYDPLVSNRYHQECLKHLIPMLDDTEAILDENLLASTIILRHLEEIEIPVTGTTCDQTSHLLGAHAFMATQERATVAGGLRRAAFWTGLRQEIYVAFVNQRSILPALEHCNLDRSFSAADDYTWASRSVVLCADVIRYCFGEETHTNAFYTWLTESVDNWFVSKPLSFQPVYYAEASEGRVFPELMFVNDEVPTGLQHYHLNKILLSAHNPYIPRLGPKRAAALKQMDEEIRHHVRTLCAIAVSNPDTPPNWVYACMGVTMCGDKFADRPTQEAMIEVLNICDGVHAWPTGAAAHNLKEAWGWTDT